VKKNPAKLKVKDDMNIEAKFIADPGSSKLLSRGTRVSASSLQTKGFPAVNAVDGNMNTRWSSEFSDPQWIAIDLGKPSIIQAVKLCWQNAHGTEYQIQVSADGKSWKTVKKIEDYVGGEQHIWLKKIRARYIRMFGTKRSTHYGYSLFEFEVYGW